MITERAMLAAVQTCLWKAPARQTGKFGALGIAAVSITAAPSTKSSLFASRVGKKPTSLTLAILIRYLINSCYGVGP